MANTWTEEDIQQALQDNPDFAAVNSKALATTDKRSDFHSVKPKPKSTMPEKKFKEQIKELAKLYGWLYYHTWKSYHSPQGYPDITLARPPRLILAELKSEEGQITESQWVWLYILQHCANVECYLWKPSDWETIISILELNY